ARDPSALDADGKTGAAGPRAGLCPRQAPFRGGAVMTPFTVGFPYTADRFGGSNASSLVLARALQDGGHRVRILSHGGDGRVAEEAGTLGLSVTRLPALSGVPGYARPDRFRVEQLTAFRAARRAIGALSLDIVHTNDLTMLRA